MKMNESTMASLYFGNERHQQLYYESIVAGVAEILGGVSGKNILDYGCGEAGGALELAARGARLALYDRSPEYHGEAVLLAHGKPGLVVIGDDDLTRAKNVYDAIIFCSVAQYVSPAELGTLLTTFPSMLTPSGVLIVADIVPEGRSALADLLWMLSLAARRGYIFPLLRTMVKRMLKSGARPEAALSLTRYSDESIRDALAAAGFQHVRRHPNITLNKHRRTYLATRHDADFTPP